MIQPTTFPRRQAAVAVVLLTAAMAMATGTPAAAQTTATSQPTTVEALDEAIRAATGRPDLAKAVYAQALVGRAAGPLQERAALGMIALHRCGYLMSADPDVRQAYTKLYEIRKQQGRLLDAADVLDALGEVSAHDVLWRFEMARFAHETGGYDAPLRFAQLRGEVSKTHSDPRARRAWELMQVTPKSPAQSFLDAATSYRPGQVVPTEAPEYLIANRDESRRGVLLDPVQETDAVHQVIKLLAATDSLAPMAQHAVVRSLWMQLDERLTAADPAALVALRTAQDADLRTSGLLADLTRDDNQVLAVFRQFAWAADTHNAMLDLANRQLWRAQPHLAARTFHDVAIHTADPKLRNKAVVGWWMAIRAQGGDDQTLTALNAALAVAAPDTVLPWNKGQLKAAEIRARLLEPGSADSRDAGPLASLRQQTIATPAVGAWPTCPHTRGWNQGDSEAWYWQAIDMQSSGSAIIVASPSMLAAYLGDDPAKPLWKRTAPLQSESYAHMPGLCRPAVVGGIIYARWGYDANFTDIAAVDASTGRQIWSTAGRAFWTDPPAAWAPVSDPVCVSGRVYFIGADLVGHVREGTVAGNDTSLYCLDAADGELLWRTAIGGEEFSIYDEFPASRRGQIAKVSDIGTRGNAVTVRDGAVYCLSNAGVVARVDARDGRLEWAAAYPRVAGPDPLRMGDAPLVFGNTVVCMPRDAAGVFALDANTGQLIWQNALVRPRYCVGVRQDSILLHDGSTVLALDGATGAVRWRHCLDEGIAGPGQLIGSSLYLQSGSRVIQADAATGIVQAERALPADRPVRNFLILGERLCIITDELAPDAPPKRDSAGGWRLARAEPSLLPLANGCYCVLSLGMIECLTPDGAQVWQRQVLAWGTQAAASSKLVLQVWPSGALARDIRTGDIVWNVNLDGVALPDRSQVVDDKYLVVVHAGGEQGSRSPDSLTVVELASGRILWHKRLAEAYGRQVFVSDAAVTCDKAQVHLVGSYWREPLLYHAAFNLADGTVAMVHEIKLPEQGGATLFLDPDARQLVMRLGGRQNLDSYRAYALDGKPLAPALQGGARADGELQECHWPYVVFRLTGGFHGADVSWIVRHVQDRSFRVVMRDYPPLFRDGKIYALQDGTLDVYDCATSRRLARLPLPAQNNYRVIADCLLRGADLVALTAQGRGGQNMRLDRFDLAKGTHVAELVLPVRDWPAGQWRHASAVLRNTAALAGDRLRLCDRDEVVEIDLAQPPQAPIALPVIKSLAVDGSLGEWKDGSFASLPFTTPDGAKGELRLARDGPNLCLAICYDDAACSPEVGRGQYMDGDWVELRLVSAAPKTPTQHWVIGADTDGEVRFDMPADDWVRLPKTGPVVPGSHAEAAHARAVGGCLAAIRHDLLEGRHVYEVRFPMPTQYGARLDIKLVDDTPRGPQTILRRSAIEFSPVRP